MDVQKIINKYAQIEWNRIKELSFPYPIVDKEQCTDEMDNLLSDKNISIKSPSCIIKRFHPSIFEDKKENKPSSLEYWGMLQKDFKLFQSFYRNRLLHSNWVKSKENEKYVNIGFLPNFVYVQGMSTSSKAPTPSYFKPAFAKYLIKKYLNKYPTIFDPFSGYSGRLLGALACNKNYIGQDLNRKHIEESRSLVEYLRKYYDIDTSYSLKVRDSLKTSGNYDCLFTCSPYSSLETWNIKTKKYSCDKWISKCLENYKCKRYVFVTDDKIKKYKKYIREKIENKSHWGTNYEYVVVIDT